MPKTDPVRALSYHPAARGGLGEYREYLLDGTVVKREAKPVATVYCSVDIEGDNRHEYMGRWRPHPELEAEAIASIEACIRDWCDNPEGV